MRTAAELAYLLQPGHRDPEAHVREQASLRAIGSDGFDARQAALQQQQHEQQRQSQRAEMKEQAIKAIEIDAAAATPPLVNGACSDCGAKWGGTHGIGCSAIRKRTFSEMLQGHLFLTGTTLVPRSWVEDDLPGQMMKLRQENAELRQMLRVLSAAVEMLDARTDPAPPKPEPSPAATAIAAVNRGWTPQV